MELDPTTVVLLLLVFSTLLVGVSRRLRLPDPIVLVIGGLVVALLPGMPEVELEPELVFALFLPPILYAAGYFTSIRDFKRNLRAIVLLSVGLVLFTMVVVAAVLKFLEPSIPWPVALAFGAIVSPPDAVAATAVFQRLGVPRRVVTILEGESLVNDATALVALNTAVAAAAIGGSFSLAQASTDFIVVAVGGIAIGAVAGWITNRVVEPIQDPVLGIVLTLLIPTATFLPAEALHLSGVLAVVTAGLIGGRHSVRALTSAQRIQGEAAWQTVLFIINGLVFILIGLQLPVAVEALSDRGASDLLLLAVVVSLVTILARIVWVFPTVYIPRMLVRRIRDREPAPKPRNVALVAWAGMRGVVSLAAALSLPADFPERPLILFLTFVVILATLVVQGLSLPWVISLLGIQPDGRHEEEEREARRIATEAAVDRIGRLEREWPEHQELVDQLRTQYTHRLTHIEPDDGEPHDEHEREILEHAIIRREVIQAEREAVIRLRDRNRISDEALRRVQRDLDLEELRLDS